MKFKFIYLAFFTSLLFLIANGRNNNKRTTESYHNNDYKVHFVVHKTKKAKTENFLERKMKRIQKKINRFVEKNDEDKGKAGKVIGIMVLIILLWLLVESIGFNSVVNAFFGGGILLFIFLCLIIYIITSRSVEKTQQQKD